MVLCLLSRNLIWLNLSRDSMAVGRFRGVIIVLGSMRPGAGAVACAVRAYGCKLSERSWRHLTRYTVAISDVYCFLF